MENATEERLRRHSAQQQALANLSSEALGGRPMADMAFDAVAMIDRVLDIRGAAIWLVQKHGAIALTATHGEQQLAEEVVRSRIDSRQSSIRERSALLLIAGPEEPAGLLAVTAPRTLRADEVHFLTAIANVIAQAIARAHSEEQLRTRAAQQIAIAQFGRFALLGITQDLLEHLCELVKAILDVDYATFLRYDSASNTFHRGAGEWWVEDDAVVPGGESTLAGYTALHGGPVIVPDFARETRFASQAAFAAGGIASGMAAEMRGERNLYGVVVAQNRSPRQFTDTDARFLQSLANTAADAMEREAAQRALAESQEQLAKANRVTSLGRLAATIAHEFNNVLMGISPFIELMKRDDLAYERRVSALDHMAKAVQRGRRITEEIYRFTNQPDPVFEPVDLSQWCQAVAQELRPLLGARYTFDVEAADDLRVRADAGQLHQILSNLVLNARDAMPGGGRIALSVRREEQFAHITLQDEGVGMTEETKQRIFDPLFTTKRHGTGLGLAITHQIVRRHSGSITVESEPGKGTAFHILLPLAP